jgi:hypothetical protein
MSSSPHAASNDVLSVQYAAKLGSSSASAKRSSPEKLAPSSSTGTGVKDAAVSGPQSGPTSPSPASNAAGVTAAPGDAETTAAVVPPKAAAKRKRKTSTAPVAEEGAAAAAEGAAAAPPKPARRRSKSKEASQEPGLVAAAATAAAQEAGGTQPAAPATGKGRSRKAAPAPAAAPVQGGGSSSAPAPGAQQHVPQEPATTAHSSGVQELLPPEHQDHASQHALVPVASPEEALQVAGQPIQVAVQVQVQIPELSSGIPVQAEAVVVPPPPAAAVAAVAGAVVQGAGSRGAGQRPQGTLNPRVAQKVLRLRGGWDSGMFQEQALL